MHSHQWCPECESGDTEVVHTEFGADRIQRVRICNECPTQWTVTFAEPIVTDVKTNG